MKIIELKTLDVQDMDTEDMMKQTGGMSPALIVALPVMISVGIVAIGSLSIIGVNYLFAPKQKK